MVFSSLSLDMAKTKKKMGYLGLNCVSVFVPFTKNWSFTIFELSGVPENEIEGKMLGGKFSSIWIQPYQK